MLYWSSLLREEDLKYIREDILQIQNTLQNLRIETTKSTHSSRTISSGEWQESDQERPTVDSSLPNQLHPDPFYSTVLPKLLGPGFYPQGTLRGALVFKPEDLHPFSNWAYVSSWVRQCDVNLARLQFGKYETLSPDMAFKLEERIDAHTGKQEFWLHLREGVYWAPLRSAWLPSGVELAPQFKEKHPVTAEDYKFCFDALMNPYVQLPGAVALRNYIQDIESVEVIDPLTLRVRWKGRTLQNAEGKMVHQIKYIAKQITGSLRPLARFVYQYFPDGTKIIPDDSSPETYRTNSVWAQNFTQHWAKNLIVSCGPWLFDGMTDRQIRFKRNPDYYLPNEVLVEASEVNFKDTQDNIWQDFKANQLDTYEIRPEQLIELASFLQSSDYATQSASGASIHRLDYIARSFYYIGWNQAKLYFSNKKVRQALTLAIDRKRIIHQNLNDMGIEITGPIYPFSNAYDKSIVPWPYDPQKSRRLLEEEGWYDHNGDGIIDKEVNGVLTPFRFTLTYYVKLAASRAICEYIATSLKEIGIDCILHGADIADLTSTFDDKGFDAIFLAWTFGTPPEEPRQLWYSSGAKQKGSSNAIGFANPEVDKIIDDLDYEANPEQRKKLYHRFHAIMHDEAPYTFLYTPKTALLYRDYVRNVFIPIERQDLVPGADVAEPDSSVFWLSPHE
jgi:peptide/nickel transport system substrate-binding protein